jgi:hypothetical protein
MSPPQVSPIQDLGDEHELNSGYRMAGLDASIALNVMQALKDIAASGKTVIVCQIVSTKRDYVAK